MSPLDLANIRPDIIYVSESAFGEVGPWQNRRGVDQIAQMVTGMAAEMGSIDSPKLFPQGYYFIDYLTGYLVAAGAGLTSIKIGDDMTISVIINVKPSLNPECISGSNNVRDECPIIFMCYRLGQSNLSAVRDSCNPH